MSRKRSAEERVSMGVVILVFALTALLIVTYLYFAHTAPPH
ncbi:MAG TPA: hypothetical protein VGG22_02195 [Candidatus Baltobacteraceae bacterium]|jgi:hypothetical protein